MQILTATYAFRIKNVAKIAKNMTYIPSATLPNVNVLLSNNSNDIVENVRISDKDHPWMNLQNMAWSSYLTNHKARTC